MSSHRRCMQRSLFTDVWSMHKRQWLKRMGRKMKMEKADLTQQLSITKYVWTISLSVERWRVGAHDAVLALWELIFCFIHHTTPPLLLPYSSSNSESPANDYYWMRHISDWPFYRLTVKWQWVNAAKHLCFCIFWLKHHSHHTTSRKTRK